MLNVHLLIALAAAFGASTMFLVLQVIVFVAAHVLNPDLATACTFITLWSGYTLVQLVRKMEKK